MSSSSKLQELAEIEGFEDSNELIEEYGFGAVVPGICVNSRCEYSTNVEPDCSGGYCEICGTQTVESALVLAGIM